MAADGSVKSARTIFRPSKTRDGYQTTEDILDQVTTAMDILDADYPNERHVFAYDNATIHTARAPDALSATGMPVKPNSNFTQHAQWYFQRWDAPGALLS